MTEDTNTPTILLVDDEELFRTSLAEALRRQTSAEVLTAGDGLEAIGLLESHSVDVVLTDLRMPGLGGVELIAALHAMSFEGRIIVVSAFINPDTEQAVRNLGAMACFEKPVAMENLIRLVRDVLRHPGVSFSGLSIRGFTRLLETEGKSCILDVRHGKQQGSLIFVHGRLTNASLGSLSGKAAAMEILGWGGSRLSLRPLRGTAEKVIHDELQYLQEEASALRDQEERVMGLEAPTVPLEEMLLNPGLEAVALVDSSNGRVLQRAGHAERLDLDAAAAGHAKSLRVERALLRRLGIDDTLEDIVLTTGRYYHLFRPLDLAPDLFLYALLDRQLGNLVLNRQKLALAEGQAAW